MIFFIIFYKFLNKCLDKNKKFLIYDINFEAMTEQESSLMYNPEKYILWFISEYIKFKNYKYQIKFYDEKKNRLQQKI